MSERSWRVSFTIADPSETVVWPAATGEASRRDGLWRHTCLEIFVGSARTRSYVEINVAPSGDWALYRFESYRKPPALPEGPAAAEFAVSGPFSRRTVSFTIDLAQLESLVGGPKWRWQPTAVLETRSESSHWAPTHPGDGPDFHRLDHLPLWDPFST